MAPTPTQLKNDLKLLDDAIKKADIGHPLKMLLGDIVESQRSIVKAHEDVEIRTGASELAIEDLLEETAEGISPQTAQILLVTLEQSRNINATFRTMITSEKNPLDDVTTRQMIALLKNSDGQISEATALVQDLIFEEEGGDDGGDGERAEGDDGEDDEDDETDDLVNADKSAVKGEG